MRHRLLSRPFTLDRPARIQVRVYARQDNFTRDVHTLHQRGWRLHSSDRQRSSIPMELTRASARGLAPQASADRIVARFVCRSTSSSATATFAGRSLGQHYAHLRQGLGVSIVRFGELVAGHPQSDSGKPCAC